MAHLIIKLSHMKEKFHDRLKSLMDELVHLIYFLTRQFPKEELYGVTSQLRRSSLSIILNYIEGYARFKPAVQVNFLEISYGSLKETKYLLNFCYKEKYIRTKDYKEALERLEEIGAMLCSTMKLKSSS